MKSGSIMAAASLLGVLALVGSNRPQPRFDVPEGFSASVYGADIAGAHDPAMQPDGTLTLAGRSSRDRYEIAPATADSPLSVLRVATELREDEPLAVKLGWHPPGETATGIQAPAQPGILAAARAIDAKDFLDVALTPDGTLFVTDARTGVVWRLSRESR